MHVWHRYNRKSHVCTFLIYGEGFERMKKVFIFGIGGFAGSYLAQEFIDNGYVVAGSDKVKSESLNKLVDFVEADLLNAENIEKIVSEKKPDMIINLAAISSVGASWGIPQITMSVNVIGALNIMEAARKIDNRPKVMFIGSSEEYAVSDKPMNEQTILNANNPYGISKMAQEKFAEVYRERYGMQIYCVRPFNHTGIGQRDSFVLPSFCKQAAVIERSGNANVGTINFYDRGIYYLEIMAKRYGCTMPSEYDDFCSRFHYDNPVFIFEPIKSLDMTHPHSTDNKQKVYTWEDRVRQHHEIVKLYEKKGYETVIVPLKSDDPYRSNDYRVRFIKERLGI